MKSRILTGELVIATIVNILVYYNQIGFDTTLGAEYIDSFIQLGNSTVKEVTGLEKGGAQYEKENSQHNNQSSHGPEF